MRISLMFVSTLLVSSITFAESAPADTNTKPDSTVRLSLNQDEIKRAHSRLLAAEEKLKKDSYTEEKVSLASTSQAESNAIKNVQAASTTTETSAKTSDKSDSEYIAIKSELSSLRRRVKGLEGEKSALLKEVNISRNRLLVAETEVERLQGILDNKSRKLMSPISLNAPKTVEKTVAPEVKEEVKNPLLSVAQEEKASADMPIVTITARKANLRIGPSETDSPLMEVAYGTRLVVETRIGEWYRVIAPTGVRAWISSKVVAFGDTASTGHSRVTKIAGFDKGVEDEAFGLISSLSN